jgi:hypothetical protein
LTGDYYIASLVLAGNGVVLFGAGDGSVKALDEKTGKPIWRTDIGEKDPVDADRCRGAGVRRDCSGPAARVVTQVRSAAVEIRHQGDEARFVEIRIRPADYPVIAGGGQRGGWMTLRASNVQIVAPVSRSRA